MIAASIAALLAIVSEPYGPITIPVGKGHFTLAGIELFRYYDAVNRLEPEFRVQIENKTGKSWKDAWFQIEVEGIRASDGAAVKEILDLTVPSVKKGESVPLRRAYTYPVFFPRKIHVMFRSLPELKPTTVVAPPLSMERQVSEGERRRMEREADAAKAAAQELGPKPGYHLITYTVSGTADNARLTYRNNLAELNKSRSGFHGRSVS